MCRRQVFDYVNSGSVAGVNKVNLRTLKNFMFSSSRTLETVDPDNENGLCLPYCGELQTALKRVCVEEAAE